MANPQKAEHLPASPIAAVREYGTLEQVLASNLSLEIKAACIELAIEARERPKGE